MERTLIVGEAGRLFENAGAVSKPRILIVSTWSTEEFELLPKSECICGYVSKHESNHLAEAVKQIAQDRVYISPELARRFKSPFPRCN